jgi:hypothetical protein
MSAILDLLYETGGSVMKMYGRLRIMGCLVLVIMATLLLSCGGGDDPEKKELLTLNIQSSDPMVNIVDAGTTWQLVAIATGSDYSIEYVTNNVKWFSSDETVATVSQTGLVTGVSGGSAVITAVLGMTRASFTVNVRVLNTIQVLPSAPSIAKGLTQQFVAWGFYSDGSSADISASVTWSSSNANASVSATGLATGDAVGTATITAAYLGVSSLTSAQSATLTVTAAEVVSIYVYSSTGVMTMAKGETLQFIANGIHTDATDVDITASVTWSTSNANASVNASGLVTGDAVGTVNIIATDPTTSISGQSSTLTIGSAAMVSIAVTPTVSIANGLTQQFTAIANYSDFSTLDVSASVSWGSTNTSVATIDGNGLASSFNQGATVINATSGSITSTDTLEDATLTVGPAVVNSIAVTPTFQTISNGATQQFIATATYTDTSLQDITGTASWSSTVPAVATMDVAVIGNAISQSIGLTIINATSGSITSTDTGGDGILNVTAALVSIEVDQYVSSPVTIINGQSYQFTATGRYDGPPFTQDLTTFVTWGTTDTLVATVDNVTVLGNATSQGEGTAIINATYSGITSTDSGQDVTLVVEPLVLESITVSPGPSVSIANGTTEQFNATGIYNDVSYTPDLTNTVLWKSSSASVATITNGSSGGLATALSESPGIIINASYAGVASIDVNLEVTAAELVSIEVTPSAQSIANGTTQQFTATGTFTAGPTQDITSSVDWISSYPLGASIGISNGFAFAESIGGPVTITATDTPSGISNTASLTVTGAWKLVNEWIDIGNTTTINNAVYHDYSADPTGTTEVVTYVDDYDTLPGVANRIYTYIYNTSGHLVQIGNDIDADGSDEMTYWYIYNSGGVLNAVWADNDLSPGVDDVDTYFYNSIGIEWVETDIGNTGGPPDDVTFYYHDNWGNLLAKGYDIANDGSFERFDDYVYDVYTSGIGNVIEHYVDLSPVPPGTYDYIYYFFYDVYGNMDTKHTDNGADGSIEDVTTNFWLEM